MKNYIIYTILVLILSVFNTFSQQTTNKIETVANREVILNIQQSLDSLNTMRLKSGVPIEDCFGVFVRSFSTANNNLYNRLRIYMDCQDSGNNTSGNSCSNIYTPKDGGTPIYATNNVIFHIYLVPKTYFSEIINVGSKYGFAVFDGIQSNNYLNHLNYIQRYFDNQDSGNDNKVTLNDEVIDYYCASRFGKNTLMSLVYFPPKENGTTLPNIPGLGYNYFVLGSFGHGQAYLTSDDEDNKNTNFLKLYTSNGNATPHTISEPNRVDWIIEGGKNTQMHFSKPINYIKE